MRQDIKQKWVPALRSGEYPQTRNVLRCEQGFCCLGVLLDVIDAAAWRQQESWQSFDWNRRMGGMGDEEIDAEMREEIGLSKEKMGELITMNDAGQSFAEIADFIEKNL